MHLISITGFFLLLACILAMATAGVSAPKDNEFEISDKEIEIVSEESICDKLVENLDLQLKSKETNEQSSTHVKSELLACDKFNIEDILDNAYSLHNDS